MAEIKFILSSVVAAALMAFALTGCSEDSGGKKRVKSQSVAYSISGFTQKGPFINGSSVTIQELDSSLDPTGLTFDTETTNDLGAFEI
ncbi:MAG: hypothetical protein IID61_16005 [SAR324 cluster bacterium]|nr:hypothetical protein [SAR324 cluster bacterium]